MRKNTRDPDQLLLPLEFDTRRLLRCSMPRPENPLHHLVRDKKGWIIRLTITAMNRRPGKHTVITKRLSLRCKADVKTERDAIIARDSMIRLARELKLEVANRQLVRGCRIDP